MSETKIQVPEGMIKAINEHWRHGVQLEGLIEAGLRWLLDRLPLPSIADDKYQGPEWATGWNLGVDAVRRMFLAPEPEVPEAIKDLLLDGADFIHGQRHADEANKQILEAYRRGQMDKA